MQKVRIPYPRPNDGARTMNLVVDPPIEFYLAKIKTITIPAILDGDNSGDIVIFTDADYANLIVPPPDGFSAAIMLVNTALPMANLAWPLAWINNIATGEIAARFFAVGGNVAGGQHTFFAIALRQPFP